MNIGEAMLNKMLQIGRPNSVKISLGYVGEEAPIHNVSKITNIDGALRRANMTIAKKKKMINQFKPRKPLSVVQLLHVDRRCITSTL